MIKQQYRLKKGKGVKHMFSLFTWCITSNGSSMPIGDRENKFIDWPDYILA